MAWLLAIPALPGLAFLALIAMPLRVRNRMLWIPVTAMHVSTVLSVAALVKVWPGGDELTSVVWHYSWELAVVAGRPLRLGFQLDSISAVLLVTVTFVATCVQIYSLSYMHKDARRGWYFAVLSLFTAAMLTLVYADNLLLLFAMWELMGLCSYLLIGFWYELGAPRRASQKAFLTTRVGDLGFMVALFMIYKAIGTWDITTVLGSVSTWAPGVATAVAAGLLLAAMGKSAQVPFHVWLPDAMAGPTPASALIHAATMVAAGVYLVARMLPIFVAAPAVLQATLVVGSVTALVGGVLACVQHDVKKVLAYSTISQLGLMFMALGAASAGAALFQLVTHAFFKSLLFLGAGVIIHSARTQDMREMGGIARRMPITSITFVIGSAALAGIFPLSGFFSKDEIITVLFHGHHYWAVGVVLVASLITAFYVTRLSFRMFLGPPQIDTIHEAHPSMVGPMVGLAAVTVVLGFFSPNFAEFLGHEGAWPALSIATMSTVAAGLGLALGWWAYGRTSVVVNTRAYKQRLGIVYSALVQKLYFDTVYDVAVIRFYGLLAEGLTWFDRRGIDGVVNGVARGFVRLAGASWKFDGFVIDGAVNGIASLARTTGRRLRTLQTGRLQSYQRLVAAAVVVLMMYLVLKGA